MIESLSKTKLEYLIVTEAKILNENDNVMIDLSPTLPEPIVPGSIYNYKTFIQDISNKASYFNIKILDPNTLTTKEYSRPIRETEIVGLFNAAGG